MTGKPTGRPKRKPTQMTRKALVEMIDTHAILERLLACARGTVEMSAESLRAAEMLLKRSMPEIRMTESKAEHTFNGDPASITNGAIIRELLDRKSSEDAGREVRRSH